MRRNRLGALALLAVGGLALAACSSGGSNSASSTTTSNGNSGSSGSGNSGSGNSGSGNSGSGNSGSAGVSSFSGTGFSSSAPSSWTNATAATATNSSNVTTLAAVEDPSGSGVVAVQMLQTTVPANQFAAALAAANQDDTSQGLHFSSQTQQVSVGGEQGLSAAVSGSKTGEVILVDHNGKTYQIVALGASSGDYTSSVQPAVHVILQHWSWT